MNVNQKYIFLSGIYGINEKVVCLISLHIVLLLMKSQKDLSLFIIIKYKINKVNIINLNVKPRTYSKTEEFAFTYQ